MRRIRDAELEGVVQAIVEQPIDLQQDVPQVFCRVVHIVALRSRGQREVGFLHRERIAHARAELVILVLEIRAATLEPGHEAPRHPDLHLTPRRLRDVVQLTLEDEPSSYDVVRRGGEHRAGDRRARELAEDLEPGYIHVHVAQIPLAALGTKGLKGPGIVEARRRDAGVAEAQYDYQIFRSDHHLLDGFEFDGVQALPLLHHTWEGASRLDGGALEGGVGIAHELLRVCDPEHRRSDACHIEIEDNRHVVLETVDHGISGLDGFHSDDAIQVKPGHAGLLVEHRLLAVGVSRHEVPKVSLRTGWRATSIVALDDEGKPHSSRQVHLISQHQVDLAAPTRATDELGKVASIAQGLLRYAPLVEIGLRRRLSIVERNAQVLHLDILVPLGARIELEQAAPGFRPQDVAGLDVVRRRVILQGTLEWRQRGEGVVAVFVILDERPEEVFRRSDDADGPRLGHPCDRLEGDGEVGVEAVARVRGLH
mmetsp:Transcript_135183/g.289072  ORF Transcript_135183/g.289072 Transcript_135183/m.289072 type:complete len:482 (+) Transcript_135183:1156-2601(+)